MATLRNKRKLAAVSRETPESTRNGRAQNILDPESTQDYISQVSEEIEGRVTKKLSKEFSRTESRILGALSKLDEFLLNPQVRTCSVVAPGTSRSNNLENQGTNEDPRRSWTWSGVCFPHLKGRNRSSYGNRSYRGNKSSHGDRKYKRISSTPSHGHGNPRRDSLLLH